MPTFPRPDPGPIAFELAAYGSLASGRETQWLALPGGQRLRDEEARPLEAFFSSGWRAANRREAAAFAFFPAGAARWALARFARLERGVGGWVVVAWFALFDTEELRRHGWPAHRLMEAALPGGRPDAGISTARVTIAVPELRSAGSRRSTMWATRSPRG